MNDKLKKALNNENVIELNFGNGELLLTHCKELNGNSSLAITQSNIIKEQGTLYTDSDIDNWDENNKSVILVFNNKKSVELLIKDLEYICSKYD